MSDFEMPYFLDGGGNKGYFKDSTSRDLIGNISQTGITGDIATQLAQLITTKNNKGDIEAISVNIDGTVQNLYDTFISKAFNMIHVIYPTGTQSSSSVFGSSSFHAIGKFSSKNYGWILCLSDNPSNGMRFIAVSSKVAYIQTPTVTVTSTPLT